MNNELLLSSHCHSLRHLDQLISTAIEMRLHTQMKVAELAELGVYDPKTLKLLPGWEQKVDNFAALYRAANTITPEPAPDWQALDSQDWAIYINPVALNPRPLWPPKYQLGQRVRLRHCAIAVDIIGAVWSGHFWVHPYQTHCWLGHRKPATWDEIVEKEADGFAEDCFQLLLPSEEQVARRRSPMRR